MNDFTKNMAQALFNQDKINDLLRKELQQAVNDLLEAELLPFRYIILMQETAGIPAILGTVPTFARWIRSLAKLKSRCHETATACFISTRCLTTSSTPMSWKT
ncbi:transposase [Lactobacillus helveticus R0052]|nr:transposase [Lactobacillus helveticus R0052]